MKRYQLLVRAQINGALCEPGHIFTLPDGVKGPHRTVVADNKGAQIADHDRPDRPQRLIDEPLYIEVIEPEVRGDV